jgi:signal transduction histidine kinase/HD-like signal output (HDOD) protein
MSEQLSAKRLELILQQLDQLPTLPAVALRVLEVTTDSDTTVLEVVGLISSDQSLTTRILQLVHRAPMGMREEVTSVERAVVLLGFEAVRSAVLALSVFETMQATPLPRPPSSDAAFSREEFWKHSIAVACAAELLAETLVETYGKDVGLTASEAFVCGLLHDVGKVALDAILPKSFAKVVEASDLLRGNIADLERTIIGLDHTVVGKRLAERWELPALLCETVWLHGQLPAALPRGIRNARLVNLITLADLIAREQHLGYSGNYDLSLPRNELVMSMGLTWPTIEHKLAPLLDRIEQRAAALNLNVPSTQELYQQAMKRANQELGKVSTQLAMKNRRLASRAQFFDALGSFQSQLRPDADPQAVLRAIGRTALGSLEAPTLAVFSLMPGQDYAQALVMDGSAEVTETTLVDCGHSPSPRPASDGPVLAAGEEMEWMLSNIGPRLPHERRFWICLSADNQCIGGIVWGAAAGEAQRLSPQAQELSALACGWQLALRMAQLREESRHLAEQLAGANRQLQSQQNDLQRGRLMISIGEMAAGAAHEMNNPLAVIAGRSQLLATQLTDAKQQGAAHLIHEQSNRLSQIISELMDYAKPTAPQARECDAAELLTCAVRDAKARGEFADTTIEVTMAAVPQVNVDERQIIGALTEVIDNALLASHAKGGHVEIHAAYDSTSRRVAVSVTDDGAGMDESTLRRAFDPFFSSKPAGRRRGMGLAKALRWVEGSGGSIKLESRLGKGTRALILLPAAQAQAVPQKTPARKAAL